MMVSLMKEDHADDSEIEGNANDGEFDESGSC